MTTTVTTWQVVTYAAGVFGMGFLVGWAKGKYGTIQNALRAFKNFVA